MAENFEPALICEGWSASPAGFRMYCEMPAKWLVEMEGRDPIKVCGRHVRSYKGEISVGWRGTITALSKVQHT